VATGRNAVLFALADGAREESSLLGPSQALPPPGV